MWLLIDGDLGGKAVNLDLVQSFSTNGRKRVSWFDLRFDDSIDNNENHGLVIFCESVEDADFLVKDIVSAIENGKAVYRIADPYVRPG
jgi:hypothetical protein